LIVPETKGRTNYGVGQNQLSNRQAKVGIPRHETKRMEFLSIHKAKGKEADYVLLLGWCYREEWDSFRN